VLIKVIGSYQVRGGALGNVDVLGSSWRGYGGRV